jgi:Flp pilus assembly protein TadD
LSRFLDYVVRRTLAGEGQSIKAYSVAVDVFGRDAGFDPQSDPIVRVQARRLRALLMEYYRGPGADDPIRIELPVGRYVPEFLVVPDQPGVAAKTRKEPQRGGPAPLWLGVALGCLVLVTAGLALLAWAPQGRAPSVPPGGLQAPSITVLEFKGLDIGDGRSLAAGLAIELVTDLAQFGTIATRFAPEAEETDAPLLESNFVLNGIARPEGREVRYSAILTETTSGKVVWDHIVSVRGDRVGQGGTLDEVSRTFSLVLGSPRGPVHQAARTLLESGVDTALQPSSYTCRLLFDLYREGESPAEAERARSCFSALPETDRQAAQALAATATLLAENSPAGETAAERTDRLRLAADHSARAVALEPTSGFAWEQRARLHELAGDQEAASVDYGSAIQLNPASGDALAAYARLLALSGALEEAEPLARLALSGTPEPPPWYHGVPALLALQDQDFATALDYAVIYAEADRELGPIIAIMAAQGQGKTDVVNRYLPQVMDGVGFQAGGVLPRLRERIADITLLHRIRLVLTEAGIPGAYLEQPF